MQGNVCVEQYTNPVRNVKIKFAVGNDYQQITNGVQWLELS